MRYLHNLTLNLKENLSMCAYVCIYLKMIHRHVYDIICDGQIKEKICVLATIIMCS